MTKPVELSIVVDDEGVRVLNKTGDELKKVGRQSDKTTGKMRRGFDRTMQMVKRLRGSIFSLKAGLAGLGAALAIGGLLKLGRSLIEPARFMERMTVSFKVLTGSIEAATARLKDLTTFAKNTPFELQEVIEASKIMRVFGIDTNNNLRLIGDAASFANVPISELAIWFGRLSAGKFGESLQRLTELGVAVRADFEGQGLTFDKGGSLKATARDAMNALGKIVEDKFGGMMQEQSKTLDGMISNFSDFVFQAKLKFGQPLFLVMKASMERVLSASDDLLDSGKLEEWGQRLADGVETGILKLAELVDFVRNKLLPSLKNASFEKFGNDLGEAIANGIMKGLTGSLPGVPGVTNPVGGLGGTASGRARFGRGGVRTDPTQDPRDVLTPAAVSAGLDRSNLAGDLRKILAATKAAAVIPDSGGVVIKDDQKDLISRPRTARPRFGVGGAFPQEGFGMPQLPGAGSIGGDFLSSGVGNAQQNTDSLRILVAENRELYQQMVVDALDNLGIIQQGWLDFKLNTLDIFGSWFEDLADTSMKGSERWNLIIDGMKRLALRSIWDMASQWVEARLTQAAGEAAVQATVAATTTVAVASAAAEGAASVALGKVKNKEAAAKIFAAHAAIPFVGTTIASGMVAQMQAVLSSVTLFNRGGIVRGGGGQHDDVPALLTRDEGVVNRAGMRRLGSKNLAALNSGGDLEGGGSTVLSVGGISVTINGNADADTIREVIADEMIPQLRELIEENAFPAGNLNRAGVS